MFRLIVLSGVAAALAGYIAITALAARRLSKPRRRLPLIEPSKLGFEYADIWFQARGEALNIAAWHIPAPGATRAVIIAHGIHRCRGQEFPVSSLALVEHLVYSGFTVLMLDLRGHGESDPARITYGIRERRDVLGAVDWLLARGYAPGAIGVLGTSMGGVAGLGAAAIEPAIGALIIDSAYADFLLMMRNHFRRFSKLPLFFLPGTLLFTRLLVGEDLARLRPFELLSKLNQQPVMIIHASGDRLVPVEHAYTLAQAGDADLWIATSTRHLGAFGTDPHDYSQRVSRFFDRALGGKPALPVAEDTIGDAARNPRRLTQTTLIHERQQEDEQMVPVGRD